jgi:hypothetical protein
MPKYEGIQGVWRQSTWPEMFISHINTSESSHHCALTVFTAWVRPNQVGF